MNWEQIQGKWQEYKGKAKQRWGHLTDNDLMVINGKRDALAGKLLERKGATKSQIDKEIAEFEATCCPPEKSADAASGGATKSKTGNV
jgi:uncharacterized protein YjbJ (UPF0337 family)